MFRKEFTLPGLMAFLNAIFVLIMTLFFYLGIRGINPFIHIFNAAIFAYVFYFLKRLLNDRFQIKTADIVIILIIVANSLNALIDFGAFALNGISHLVGISIPYAFWKLTEISMKTIWVSCGILFIVLSVILLIRYETINTLLKIFSIIAIGLGICLITLVFARASVIFDVASMIVLGIIFLKADEGLEFV